MENANAESIIAIIVGIVTGIWSWFRSRKDADIVQAAKEELAKAILSDIRYSKDESKTIDQIIAEFSARARQFTTSEKLNKALLSMSDAEIMWAFEQIKVRDGDATQW